jgi:hypothetical protein
MQHIFRLKVNKTKKTSIKTSISCTSHVKVAQNIPFLMKDHRRLTVILLVNLSEVYDLCAKCIKWTHNVEVSPLFLMFHCRNNGN